MNSLSATLVLLSLVLSTIEQKCDHIMDRFEWQKHIIPQKDGEKYYWKSTPPQDNESVPVELKLRVIPTSIRKISLFEQTIEIQYALLVFWEDCRLNIPSKQERFRILASEISRDLWVPTFECRNCIEKDPIVFDERIHTIFVSSNSTLGYFSRRVSSLHCSYDLSGYPMDSQRCKLEIRAGVPDSIIVMKILPHEKVFTRATAKIKPPQYIVKEIQIRHCAVEFSSTVQFSCVELYFVFSRQITFHLGVTFLPSILIVILTWISFWMDVDASAPRVVLGLTSMLTLITTYVNAQKDLPAVSYLKAIDIYMFACILLVFASLIEFCLANYLSRVAKGTAPHRILVNELKNEKNENIRQERKPALQKTTFVSSVDKMSRIIFPLLFITFNIAYWIYFLY